jgi:hypothetical protein
MILVIKRLIQVLIVSLPFLAAFPLLRAQDANDLATTNGEWMGTGGIPTPPVTLA